MSLFFILNNLHFAIEVLGALAFIVVAWLALDAYFLRRDFLTASRFAGFAFLAAWQIIHAFNINSDPLTYFGVILYILGLVLVLLNLILERPVGRPKFEAILILPAISVAMFYNGIAASLLYLAITFMAYQQYKHELKKSLRAFLASFSLLSLGAVASIFYGTDSLGILWIMGHLFEIAGFGALILWVWQYLQLRIKEEMVLIFASAALMISIVVTMAFSIILVSQIEEATRANLLTNAKVLDLYISRLKEEALAKTRFVAETSEMENLLTKRDFRRLNVLAEKYLEDEKLEFLILLDKNGEVILRAHALSQREDNLSGEAAVKAALAGENFVTIESSPAEKFSIRAASPLRSKNRVVGAVVAGFFLDNALVDNIKRVTGLEMSILEGNAVVSTTLLGPDGRTRGLGVKITDLAIISNVLGKGEALTLRTEILSRPALASYLPLKNADGKIVGMVSSVKPQQEILALANATNRLTLVTVVILMLILAFPIYLLTKRLTEDIV